MIGGPNGSGKSTLLDYLSTLAVEKHFSLGFIQNPDALEREAIKAKRLYLGLWGVRATDEEFQIFVRDHPLYPKVRGELPRIDGDVLLFADSDALGYLIPILCDFLRQRWIASGESFTFETVMSGRDKIDVLKLAKRKHYRTYLYFICTDDVAINEARIANRVSQGGHPVPPEKVATRYERSLGQLAKAIKTVDRAYLFDNSGREHQIVASFEAGRVVEIYGNRQPRWFVEEALNKL